MTTSPRTRTTPTTETPQLDERKKIVSEILKRVERHINLGELEEAQAEVDKAKKVDDKNLYIRAFEERIQLRREFERSKPAQPVPSSAGKLPEPTPSEPKATPIPTPIRAEPTPLIGKHSVRTTLAEAAKIVKRSEHLFKQPVVVVIDDDNNVLEILSETLALTGYQVKPFSTSDEAYAWLRQNSPDLILCDINLETSSMGGFSFYEKVRGLASLNEVPFVFLSGLSDDVLIYTGKELGVDDYLTKPISEQMLLATIRGKIKRYRLLKSMRN